MLTFLEESFVGCQVFVKHFGQGGQQTLAHNLKNLRNMVLNTDMDIEIWRDILICFESQENLENTNTQPQSKGSTKVGEKIANVKLQIAGRGHANLEC